LEISFRAISLTLSSNQLWTLETWMQAKRFENAYGNRDDLALRPRRLECKSNHWKPFRCWVQSGHATVEVWMLVKLQKPPLILCPVMRARALECFWRHLVFFLLTEVGTVLGSSQPLNLKSYQQKIRGLLQVKTTRHFHVGTNTAFGEGWIDRICKNTESGPHHAANRSLIAYIGNLRGGNYTAILAELISNT